MTKHVETIYTSAKKLNKFKSAKVAKKAEMHRIESFEAFVNNFVHSDNKCYVGMNGIVLPQPIFN